MREVLVFLVDDSIADATLIKMVAKQSKLSNEIRHFEDGQSALDHMNDPGKELPDLMLLDLNMPGMSGHDVLERIRSTDRLRRLPVVVLTSSEDESDVARSYDEHVNAYVVKPIGVKGFQQIVESIEQFWFTIVKLPPRPSQGVLPVLGG